MSWTAWTVGQERLLVENSALGAVAVSDLIFEACGVRHTPEACRQHASQMGVSLVKRGTCARCGKTYRMNDMTADGCCRACHWKELASNYGCTLEQVGAQLATLDDTEARRKYDRMRQWHSSKKHKEVVKSQVNGSKRCEEGACGTSTT